MEAWIRAWGFRERGTGLGMHLVGFIKFDFPHNAVLQHVASSRLEPNILTILPFLSLFSP